MEIDMTADRWASQIKEKLEHMQTKVVFAESCTAGLAAATMGEVPGVSAVFCGSAVTYREATKRSWLNVQATTIQQETAVSSAAAVEMALGALQMTPEATWSVSVTGHLGPDAPQDQDGKIFVAVAKRDPENEQRILSRECVQLNAQMRIDRQREAVAVLLQMLMDQLDKC